MSDVDAPPLPLEQQVSEHDHRQQRNRAWIGLAMAILVATAAQLCWKAATAHTPAGAGAMTTLRNTFTQPLFLLAMLLYAAQFFNWMWVLSNADLSYAQPIAASSNLTIVVLAWMLLGEQIPVHRALGLTLILLGVCFISRTSHRTVKRKTAHAPGAPPSAEVMDDAQAEPAAELLATAGVGAGESAGGR